MSVSERIALFLMNIKGYHVVRSIVDTLGADCISCVVSSCDEKVQKDYYEEICSFCREHAIRCFDRTEEYDLNSHYSFAIGWRWLIKRKSDHQVIVFHDSLLPRYRGFAPLVSCLINKEEKIGVTAIFASDEYDKGDIIGQKSIKVKYPITIKEAIDVITPLYAELAVEIARKIVEGDILHSTPQDEKVATYSLWRDEEDYRIEWGKDADYIKRFIDAVGFPYLGAYSYMDGKKVRIIKAELYNDVVIENRTPGKLIFMIDGFPVVVCGKGLLKLTEILDDSTKRSILPLKKFRVRFT